APPVSSTNSLSENALATTATLPNGDIAIASGSSTGSLATGFMLAALTSTTAIRFGMPENWLTSPIKNVLLSGVSATPPMIAMSSRNGFAAATRDGVPPHAGGGGVLPAAESSASAAASTACSPANAMPPGSFAFAIMP